MVMAESDPLELHRWKHRLLLVFTPDLEAEQARTLEAALEQAGCEVADRDLVVGWLSAADGNRLADEALDAAFAARLRARLGVGVRQFAVFLVGKDGGVKARYGAAPALETVFGLIDGMPMRRTEMRERADDCSNF